MTLIDGGPAYSQVIELVCERCALQIVHDVNGKGAKERAAVVEDARAHWEAHARGEYPLTFYPLPGVDDMKVTRVGTWTDVVLAVPYFVSPANGPPPPRTVVNSVLREGVAFAGMSGGAEWPRHELDAEEYETLRTDLVTRGHPNIAPPGWVDSAVAYRDWVVSLLWRCSPRAARAWLEEVHRLNDRMNEARRRGDQAEMDEIAAIQSSHIARRGDWARAYDS